MELERVDTSLRIEDLKTKQQTSTDQLPFMTSTDKGFNGVVSRLMVSSDGNGVLQCYQNIRIRPLPHEPLKSAGCQSAVRSHQKQTSGISFLTHSITKEKSPPVN